MNVVMEEGWKSVLKDEFEKEYFVRLRDFVHSEYRTQTIYPPARLIFNAFDTCPFDKVKVVILGHPFNVQVLYTYRSHLAVVGHHVRNLMKGILSLVSYMLMYLGDFQARLLPVL